ncbi:unnamed protein product [Prorocentrum cordatum]|uniref:Uncharacterized protein n=1 Tax=Prorocentrum cordatum TaxID=2364126 RepID=A0ABN9RUF9_9DINO|nr:unnamed protein product [Polarella glacialis]
MNEPSVSKSLAGSIDDVVPNLLGSILQGANGASVAPMMDQMLDSVARRASAPSARTASLAGSPQGGGDGAEVERVEQMVRCMMETQLEESRRQLHEFSLRVRAELSEALPAGASATVRGRSPGPPLRRHGRQCERSDRIVRRHGRSGDTPADRAPAASSPGPAAQPTSPGLLVRIAPPASPINYGILEDIIDADEAEEVHDYIMTQLFRGQAIH